jgi:hypothetical protein
VGLRVWAHIGSQCTSISTTLDIESPPASICGGPYCTPPLLSSTVSQPPARIVVGHPSVTVSVTCVPHLLQRSTVKGPVKGPHSPSSSAATPPPHAHDLPHHTQPRTPVIPTAPSCTLRLRAFCIFYRPQYQTKHRIG